MTRDVLEKIKLDYFGGIVRHENTFALWHALEQALAELDDLKRQHKDCLEQKEALRERTEELELGYRGFP